MKSTFVIHTLGCKTNQYESDALAQLLKEHGYLLSNDQEKADILIVNSCTVTAVSASKSRQAVRKFRKNNPDSVVVLTGCYVQTEYEKACKMDVDIVAGIDKREKIPQFIEQRIKFDRPTRTFTPSDRMHHMDALPLPIQRERTRAVLKIQDGCDSACSYCIIPHARGSSKSRTRDEVMRCFKKLANEGYKEVVLTGIHLTSYGKNVQDDLIDLLTTVQSTLPDLRIRLGSLDPLYFTKDRIDRLCALDVVQPHYHLSLQSGCDETLRRMNRPYDTNMFEKIAWRFMENRPDCHLTTDVIVGFPYESVEEFEKTAAFVQKMKFYQIHVFPYSKREGTKAACMHDGCSKSEKRKRAEVLQNITARHRLCKHESMIGTTVRVLFESCTDVEHSLYEGTTPNYVRAVLKSDKNIENTVCDVRVVAARQDTILTVQV